MKGRERAEPVQLSDAIAAVNRELGLPDPGALLALTSAWPRLVGATLARHASLRSVRDGVCTIEVDGPAWATQLRYLESQLVTRAEEVCGTAIVQSVRIVVAPPGRTG